MSERIPGFYWVRFCLSHWGKPCGEELIVAEWRSDYNQWMVPGTDEDRDDVDCDVIAGPLEPPA